MRRSVSTSVGRLLGFALRYIITVHVVFVVFVVIHTLFDEGTNGLLPALGDLRETYVELWVDGFAWVKKAVNQR